MNRRALILAAGRSTRMKSEIPKMLQMLFGKTIIRHVADTVKSCIEEVAIIVNNDNFPHIRDNLGDNFGYIIQEQLTGTATAVRSAIHWLKDFHGQTLIVVGDAPLIKPTDLINLINTHENDSNNCTFLSAIWETPPDFGRVIRSAEGNVIRIVEEKDASVTEKLIREVNTSHYCFNNQDLMEAIEDITPLNNQQEYYLTDVIAILISKGKKVEAVTVEDPFTTIGINTIQDLELAKKLYAGMIESGHIND